MVNQCCVNGCGRNSSKNSHLNFYSFPKERERKLQWLNIIERQDLIPSMVAGRLHHRVCSRHFTPTRGNKIQLPPDAMPSKHLPGIDLSDDEHPDIKQHPDIVCNYCSEPVVGFCYKCITCEDYDLCIKCEMKEIHREHYMLRIPKPVQFKQADQLKKEMKKLLKNHLSSDEGLGDSDDSSDDEPIITMCSKNYDSGVDLAPDIKDKIRKEVNRVLKLTPEELKSKAKSSKKNKRNEESNHRHQSKKPKLIASNNTENKNVPEMVFADVGSGIEDDVTYIKTEFPNLMASGSHSESGVGDSQIAQTEMEKHESLLPCEGQSYNIGNEELQSVTVTGNTAGWSDSEQAQLLIEVTNNQKILYYKYN